MEKKIFSSWGNVVVFDSGIGGLKLLYECVKKVPAAHYYFISDNKNVPYGNRPSEEVYRLTLKALKGIERLSPLALVVACNTVTANCIDKLRKKYSFPVIGIQPAVKQAAVVGGTCLVLATQATVKSQSFTKLVSRFPNLNAKIIGCKQLADYVEQNILNLPENLPESLLPRFSCDSVVLGCTHYAFVRRQIERVYRCPVFDGFAGTANHFAEIVGMSDHFKDFLGIFDHQEDVLSKVTFYRGDNAKNLQIFNKILSKNV